MEILKIIFWAIAWLFAVTVVISFLKGSKHPDPTELHAENRYNATALLEKQIKDEQETPLF